MPPAPYSRPRTGEHSQEGLSTRVSVLEALVAQNKEDVERRHTETLKRLDSFESKLDSGLSDLHEKANAIARTAASVEASCSQCHRLSPALERKPTSQDTTIKLRRGFKDQTLGQFFGGAAVAALKIITVAIIVAGILMAVGAAYFHAKDATPIAFNKGEPK